MRSLTTASASRSVGDVSRRSLLAFGGLGIALAATACASPAAPAATRRVAADLRSLEQSSGVMIGVHAEDVVTRQVVANRSAERFPMCSLFKVLAVGALATVHSPYDEFWQRQIGFTPADLVEDSPITSATTAWTMTASELADAAIRFSDNTAGNLLLRELGGPTAITDFAVSLGATTTRLDRWEPELNEAIPGDLRDTSTPADIALLYRRVLVDDTLGILGQARLRDWMLRNTTSSKRIRAGLTGQYELADKTGAGSYGVVNNAGVLWPAKGTPVVIAIQTRSDDPAAEHNNSVIAEATAIVMRELAG